MLACLCKDPAHSIDCYCRTEQGQIAGMKSLKTLEDGIECNSGGFGYTGAETEQPLQGGVYVVQEIRIHYPKI